MNAVGFVISTIDIFEWLFDGNISEKYFIFLLSEAICNEHNFSPALIICFSCVSRQSYKLRVSVDKELTGTDPRLWDLL